MNVPPGWTNPIRVAPGRTQSGIDPSRLLPARDDLSRRRLDVQRGLLRAGQDRLTPILVSKDGVVIDGHHAVRAAAEAGVPIEVLVSTLDPRPKAATILDLPVR